MKHWVAAYREIPGVASELRRQLRVDVTELLRAAVDPEAGTPEPDGSLLLRLPAQVAGFEMHKQIRVRTGVATERDDRTCIPLEWEAYPSRQVFPVFHGTIELEPMSSRSVQICVVGAVTPPMGPLGGVVDTILLGQVGERTVDHLADGLARGLRTPVAQVVEEPDTSVPPARLKVREVMTPEPLVLFDDLPLKTAALLLFHYEVAGAPVQTKDGGLIGVLSEADLLSVEAPPYQGLGRRLSDEWRRRRSRTVGEACSRPALVVSPDATVADAASLMRDHGVARLVVVEGSEIVGVVSRHDVLRPLMRSDTATRAAVDAVLRGIDEQDIEVEVEWGVATVVGDVDYHSTAEQLISEIEAVDGVIGVDNHLRWRRDDLVPPVMM